MLDVILHQPSNSGEPDVSPGTTTLTNVASFETEFGDQNTVHVEYIDGETVPYTGIGLTVSGATIDSEAAEL